MKKRILSLLLMLCMVVGMLPTMASTAQAATNEHTQEEAVAKARELYENPYDYDGVNRIQCVDLAVAYYQYLGHSTSGYARDYMTNSLPSGWNRYSNTQATPQPGDIVVFDAGYETSMKWASGAPVVIDSPGHVAIVVEVNTSWYKLVEYNGTSYSTEHEYPLWDFSCVIRPDWPTQPSQPDTPTIPDTPNVPAIPDVPATPSTPPIKSGTCGDNAAWAQYSDGTVVISGTGPMKNYSVIPLPNSPWSMSSTIKTVKIEDGITRIGNDAFGWMFGLKTLVIPKSVVSIGSGAFTNTNTITDIYYAGTEKDWDQIVIASGNYPLNKEKIHYEASDSNSQSGTCGAQVNWSLSGDGTLTISGIGDMTDYDPYDMGYGTAGVPPWYAYKDSIKSVIIKDGVTSVGNCAFFECKNITSAAIPDSVTKIGRGAFWRCSSLSKTQIPDSVTTIGDYAFAFCVFPNMVIPDKVTSIGYSAFGHCDKMVSITIPEGVKTIGDAAFYECYALTSVVLPDGISQIGEETFTKCQKLSEITIPRSVTQIGPSAFAECSALNTIYFGGSRSEWIAVSIGSENGRLSNGNEWIIVPTGSENNQLSNGDVSVYCSSTEPDNPKPPVTPDEPNDSEDISKITIPTGPNNEEKSIQSLFSKPSIVYDNDLALFAANLSRAVEDQTGDNILNYYRSLEWPDKDREIYQYGGDRAYSIACAKLSKDENLLVITARGSQTWSEFFEDGLSFGHRDFFGYTTNDVIYDFERDIMTGLNQFLKGREYLMEKDLKILITGHSLGGAAANLNAARFTMFEDSGAWWSDLTEQSDIYCYTFGAINSLADNSTVKNDFENIHNIYNLLDSFGPNRCGNQLPSGLGRGYGKFGHMEMYSHNYETSLYIPIVDSTNHLIENYIDSLNNGYVSCKKNSPFIIHGGGIWCPVDLKIYLETADDPVLVGSITDNQIDEVKYPMVGLHVEGDKKYFYLPDDGNYIIKLEGTNIGTMTYFVGDMNAETGEPIDNTGIVYQQVQLIADKHFYSDIKVEENAVSGMITEKVPLYVLDENGKPEKEVLPGSSGTEVPITPDPATYTVTFDGFQTMTTNSNGKLSNLPTPTRDGYTFNGWYTALDGGEKITANTVFTKDTTVYAHWTQNITPSEPTSFTITFDADGGSVTPKTAVTDTDGKLTSALPTPERRGYTFTGWFMADGTRVYASTVYSRDTTIYARWTSDTSSAETYYISILSSQNGEIIPSTRHAEEGDRVTLSVHPDKGYELDELTVSDARGRRISLRGSGNSYSFTMPSSRVTVEAEFVRDAANSNGDQTAQQPDDQVFTGLGTPGISGIVLNPAPMPFTDVHTTDWFYSNVDYVWKHYLMSGVSETQFAPKTTTSRAMIWTILARMNNIRTDVNPGSTWYERGMLWAMEQGITDGSSAMGDITREQLAAMLWRSAGSPGGGAELNQFSDAGSVSSYALSAVRWAVANNILRGSDNMLNPKGTATRAEVAAMVMRYGENIGA